MRAIVDKAAGMQFERDLLQTGLKSNAPERRKIAGLVGFQPKPVETAILQYKHGLLQAMGFPYGTKPPTQKDYLRAMLMDQMIAQGMTRQEAQTQVKVSFGL